MSLPLRPPRFPTWRRSAQDTRATLLVLSPRNLEAALTPRSACTLLLMLPLSKFALIRVRSTLSRGPMLDWDSLMYLIEYRTWIQALIQSGSKIRPSGQAQTFSIFDQRGRISEQYSASPCPKTINPPPKNIQRMTFERLPRLINNMYHCFFPR